MSILFKKIEKFQTSGKLAVHNKSMFNDGGQWTQQFDPNKMLDYGGIQELMVRQYPGSTSMFNIGEKLGKEGYANSFYIPRNQRGAVGIRNTTRLQFGDTLLQPGLHNLIYGESPESRAIKMNTPPGEKGYLAVSQNRLK